VTFLSRISKLMQDTDMRFLSINLSICQTQKYISLND